MLNSRRLALYHYWVAFAVFMLAVVLGAWQMLTRSPLPAPFASSSLYYGSVTLHGTAMAYVVTTFFAMGFGYAVTATSLDRPVRGVAAAWIGFGICLIGTLMAVAAVLSGQASVLYTFYPPLFGSTWYYAGAFLLIGGSMIWVALMVVNMAAWKRDHPGQPVPLPMFAITATAFLWAWAASGAELELAGVILPRAFGFTSGIDAGLARTLFSITLHSIVYFWLMPAYIAFYTLVPQAAGGRLYSDTMGRLTFIMFLVFSVPVGVHHLFMDPEIGLGFKYVQSFLTFLIALPTLLTVFSVCASLEIAGRNHGGRGLLGWIAALPWHEPMVLAVGLSLLMLGLGGLGGLINMAYDMNAMIHNTAWIPAHFHLIFGGTVVIMYFAIAYEMWPRITGKPLRFKRLARWQLWLWFIGMMVTSLPWHVTGLMGQPRRVAFFDYTDPLLAPMAPLVIASVIGAAILLASAVLLIVILVRSQLGERALAEPLRYALAVNPPVRVPAALNGFGIWNAILLVFMLVNYGYPIAQFFFLKTSVPIYDVTQATSFPEGR
ncbi:cbb3-type cytochrome c oxidase subunit I [Bradyrhizobium sp. Arg237L]|uniref:cbb3-type cytochrome c oxidase subunit I n=1 Tax=Bradyrhizobium sp. Arg237L TaxID=3003352 RepID=UPI00249E46C4|nr:cbb3-type cytochrome c oxidase subunit I [Bradyrhizobium sp. Arg237L]MDI4239079.1 cbb3-type cytochrome c oxidase subunit I [Bradyrhizobium sp. Arg237L]